ncbi:hypothetical protein FOC1_g10006466 [Fusarium oxysporum f. sp. cubense race 1]|uniref:CHAT domain-containing protein n=1 Tax=Fusarium oxysporum f. sp. cubense (strain race 1) TaxID=1229664 RepID=N4UTI5_FUSC1|nr:hypothetical protein FOC1_g10006466 [Fusarium oxysporum f. sp. cubense race 1]
MLATKDDWREASRITELAVNLVQTVAPHQLSQHDQQHLLDITSGIATLAASFALEARETLLHVVRLLELGRGIITGLRSGLRSDVSELKERHPRITERFEKLRDILDSPIEGLPDIEGEGGSLGSGSKKVDRHQASFDLDDTIRQIRLLPGFENFPRPPRIEELNSAASQGPMVIINSSEYRSGAFLIEKIIVRSIRLPDLHHSDVREKVKMLMSIRSNSVLPQQAEAEMSSMLRWPWDVAVRPILDTLDFSKPPMNDEWPRVWWIPTGELSSLPLHAVGNHASSSTDSEIDRVVSSYSPSVRALLHARRHSGKARHSMTHQALLVSMKTTTGCSKLSVAKREVKKLERILPASMAKVKLEQSCSNDVLKGLNECSIFHFAGHGKTDLSDASKSSLLTNDWKENTLTVEHLINLNLNKTSPWLAYLSACSTSRSHSPDLQDEAIHLVTTCQLAGFQHVIGSL